MNIIYNLDNRVLFDKELAKIPKVVYVSKFNEESAKQFNYDMNEAAFTEQEIIPVVIDSYGGEVYSLINMIDTINSMDKKVATIAKGKAMSCGSLLLTCGTKGYRYVTKNTAVMIHDISAGLFGKIEEIKADAKQGEKIQKWMLNLLDTNCGKTSGYFEKEIHERHHADWYLTAEECVKEGLVDRIGSPSFQIETKFSVNWME